MYKKVHRLNETADQDSLNVTLKQTNKQINMVNIENKFYFSPTWQKKTTNRSQIHKQGLSAYGKNQNKTKNFLFVTQYQPTVSITLKKLIYTQKMPSTTNSPNSKVQPPIISYKKGKSFKDKPIRALLQKVIILMPC